MQKRVVLIIAIISAIVITTFFLLSMGISFGLQATGVDNLTITKTEETSYRIMFDFCRIEKNIDAVGVSVRSEMEFVSIPVNHNQDLGQCHEYGTNIHTADKSLQ